MGIRVGIVGAGIAGLAVARSLARSGHECVVYEQAPRAQQPGSGIQISPNASKLLHRDGLVAALDAVSVRPDAIEFRSWRGNELLARTELGTACEKAYGAPYYTLHRNDLLAALRSGVAIEYGQRCVGVREDAGGVSLRFASGLRTTVDLVVGADGVHSTVRAGLGGTAPRYTGIAAYRGLVPADCLPDLAKPPRVTIWLGEGQHCVCYPVRGGDLLNVVATVPVPRWRGESWTIPGLVASLRGAYAGWPEVVRQLLVAADPVTCTALYEVDPPPRWRTDRTVGVGDAVHAMLPFGAQGANQAIEDAATLAACLDGICAAGVSGALAQYERLRAPRVARVAAAVRGNARDHHLPDGARQAVRDRAMAARRGLAAQAWLYGYDAGSVAR